MSRKFASIATIIGVALFVGSFQNCAPASLSSSLSQGLSAKSSASSSDTPPSPPPAPPPSAAGQEVADIDQDQTPVDEGEVEGGDICIGNGIKVSGKDLVKCANGDMKCVIVCTAAKIATVTFHEARSLLSTGSTAGACK